MTRQLPAKKFAVIDPEEYYDFSQQRPVVSTNQAGSRVLEWPVNDFYYWKSENENDRDLVLFLGTEPNLRWRHYSDQIKNVAMSTDVRLLITVGALLDSVPHTRNPRVTGSSSDENLGPGFEDIHYSPPVYEGPSGMTSVVMDVLGRQNVRSASLWGHVPHYVQVSHNPTLTAAILRELQPFLPKRLELDALEKESEEFAANLVRALEDQKDIEGYVKRLEERYDSEEETRGSPEPRQLVQELEEFLRQQRSGPGGDGESNA